MQRDGFRLIFGAVFLLVGAGLLNEGIQEETLCKRRPLRVLLFCLLGR
jgi:hypothetical protein